MTFLVFLFLIFVPSFSHQCPAGWNISTVVQNKCYLIVPEKKDWFNAEYYCQNSAGATGAQLVSICNAFENALIGVLVSNTPAILLNTDQVWIGLNDIGNDGSGEFTWANENDNCTYRHWGPGQPRLGITTECVSSTAKSTGYWSTKSCATENYFICEFSTDSSTISSTSSTAGSASSTSSAGLSTKTPALPDSNATDCFDVQQQRPFAPSGVYTIHPPNASAPFEVYCDMLTDNGGWTVFQRRFNGSQDFTTQNWTNYESGFGDVGEEHWLGLEKLYWLIEKDNFTEMRIDLTDCIGQNVYEAYERFKIGNAVSKYALLQAGGAHGTARDSLAAKPSQIGSKFSTRDQDHDGLPFEPCAEALKGGWWYSRCGNAHLNSVYYPQCNYAGGFQDGITWDTLFSDTDGFYHSLAETKMMIRRVV
uniref:Fibrinogen C-terminal domain-containing protein n=1 Tax=Plectus sambesii TaxID=2011161 RepID=A0A914VGZ5_9BILA